MTALTRTTSGAGQLDGLGAAANNLAELFDAEASAWGAWAHTIRRPLLTALTRLGVSETDAEGAIKQLSAAMSESAARLAQAAQEYDSIRHAVDNIVDTANAVRLPSPAKAGQFPTGIS